MADPKKSLWRYLAGGRRGALLSTFVAPLRVNVLLIFGEKYQNRVDVFLVDKLRPSPTCHLGPELGPKVEPERH